MERKDQIDLFGAVALSSFALLLAFNQVVIKVTNGGIQPVFFAGLRSVGAVFCLWLWLKWRGIPLRFSGETAKWGTLTGVIFGFEFLCLFGHSIQISNHTSMIIFQLVLLCSEQIHCRY